MKMTTKERILEAALSLAMKGKLRRATRKQVAELIDMDDRLINYHFGSVPKLWDAVVSHACVTPGRYLEIVGQAVIDGDESAVALCEEVKVKAFHALANARA